MINIYLQNYINIWDTARGKTSDDYIINILNKSNNGILYINQSSAKITDGECEYINNFYSPNGDFKANINRQITAQLKSKINKYTFNYNGLKVNVKNGNVSYNNKYKNVF